ncbi:MAG: hypothetical protein J4G15_16395, partial [Alphaproteobacteria bacterium]|nr:hypothetical protein [Alphaproteobacteria bacterium]
MTTHRVIGVVLGIVGVVVISRPDALSADARLLGIGLCLSGALSYGFAALWGRRHLADVAPIKSTTCQLLASTLIIAMVVAVVGRPWTLAAPSAGTWLARGRSRCSGPRLRTLAISGFATWRCGRLSRLGLNLPHETAV